MLLLNIFKDGCPDYNRRPVFLNARTDRYSLTMEAKLQEDFEKATIYSVFDIQQDKMERKDLKKKADQLDRTREKEIIRNLLEELQEDEKENNYRVK